MDLGRFENDPPLLFSPLLPPPSHLDPYPPPAPPLPRKSRCAESAAPPLFPLPLPIQPTAPPTPCCCSAYVPTPNDAENGLTALCSSGDRQPGTLPPADRASRKGEGVPAAPKLFIFLLLCLELMVLPPRTRPRNAPSPSNRSDAVVVDGIGILALRLLVLCLLLDATELPGLSPSSPPAVSPMARVLLLALFNKCPRARETVDYQAKEKHRCDVS